MSEPVTSRAITMDMVHNALNLVTYENPNVVEAPGPVCDWPKLCGEVGCRFPRYSRAGSPSGLVSAVLVALGYPVEVLKELDHEHEMGELLHPGVKISRSRNLALLRIDNRGMALLTFLQDHQKVGKSWQELAVDAFRPRRTLRRLDARRRPWLY